MNYSKHQLHLFKSKRGEEPPPALEFKTCCALADHVDFFIMPDWRFSHLPFGEHRNVVTGARLKRTGTKRGWPDYVFLGPRGKSFWLEMKRGKLGRISEPQALFADFCARNGHDYLCASSYEVAVAALEQRGIIRKVIK